MRKACRALTGAGECSSYAAVSSQLLTIDLLYSQLRSYAAEGSIGTPQQNFWLILDTGSSDLVVYDSSYPTRGDPVYQPSQSSTSRRTGLTNATLGYGGGLVFGDQYVDTVNFSGFPIEDFAFFTAVKEQPVNDITAPGVSGILGLAGTGLTTAGDSAFLQALLDQQGVDSIAFSFALRTELYHEGPPTDPSGGGIFTIGTSLDSSQYTGDLYTIPVTGARGQRWYVDLQGGAFDDIEFSPGYALFDTGTSDLSGPPDVVNAIYNSIPGAFSTDAGWRLPCNASFTRFEFALGGNTFSLGPQDIFRGNANNASDPNLCVGSLDSSDGNGDWTMGDIFFRNYFVGFLFGPNPAISIAQLPQGGPPPAPSTTTGIPGPTTAATVNGANVPPATSFASSAATASGASALGSTKAGATQSALVAISTSAASGGGRGGNGKSNGAMAMSVAGADWLALLLTTAGGLVGLLVMVL